MIFKKVFYNRLLINYGTIIIHFCDHNQAAFCNKLFYWVWERYAFSHSLMLHLLRIPKADWLERQLWVNIVASGHLATSLMSSLMISRTTWRWGVSKSSFAVRASLNEGESSLVRGKNRICKISQVPEYVSVSLHQFLQWYHGKEKYSIRSQI